MRVKTNLRWGALALSVALGSGRVAVAQQEQTPEARLEQTKDGSQPGIGARVRVELAQSDRKLTGDVIGLDEETLTLFSNHRRIVELPRDLIRKLEISDGRRGHPWWGLVIGLTAGALLGAAENADHPSCIGENCFTRADNITYGSLGAGIIGTLVGALYQTDSWVEIPFASLRPEVGPNPLGPGVIIILSF